MNNLNVSKQELSELLYTKSVKGSAIKRIIGDLKDLFTHSQNPSEDIYNMIGELMMINPEHFMKSLFPEIRKRLSDTVDFEEMDECILKKYCFHEEEEIISQFPGVIGSAGIITTGQVYVTNYRIIACGTQKKAKSVSYFPGSGLITAAINLAINSAIKSQRRKTLSEALDKKITMIGKWGYDFPIHDVIGITITKGAKINALHIIYVKVFYTQKKAIGMRVAITPYFKTPISNKTEIKEAIDHIYQLLEQNTKKIKCPKCNTLMDPIEPTTVGSSKFLTDVYKCSNCKKIIKQKKKICPNCKILMELSENADFYQCPECKAILNKEN